MMDKIRVGVVGCGARAQVYGDGAAGVPALQLCAYADVNGETAERFLDRYGGVYATEDADRVLTDRDLDAVFICTWHDTHTRYAVKAARHGKHVLIEKPMALTIDACWEIEDAVTRADVTACVGLKMRFMPLVRRAKQLVGRPLMMHAQMMNARIPDDAWSLQPAIGGGPVLGAGCHLADLLCFFADADPVEVFGAGGAMTHGRVEIYDNVVATVKFANGVVATLMQGDAARNPYASTFFCEVFGDNTSACLHDRFHQVSLSGCEVNRLGAEDLTACEQADIEGDVALLRHFCDCVLHGKASECGAREGRVATTLMVKLIESIELGQARKVETHWRAQYT